MFGLSLHICLAKFHATLLVQSACREVSSGGCSPKPSAQGFRSWGSPFWIMPPDSLFLSRIQFCTKCILRISGVSRRRMEFIGSESWDKQPCTFFFFQHSNCAGFPFTVRLVDIGNDSHKCICFQTCNHDRRDDVDTHTTTFFHLAHNRQGFF